jgi:hypothetical protein
VGGDISELNTGAGHGEFLRHEPRHEDVTGIVLAKSAQIVGHLSVLAAERQMVGQKHGDAALAHGFVTVVAIAAEGQNAELLGARRAQRQIHKPGVRERSCEIQLGRA